MISGHSSYFASEQDYIDYIDSEEPEPNRCIYCGEKDCEDNPVVEVEMEYKGKIVKEYQCLICKNAEP